MNICQDRRWLSTALCIATSLLAVGAFAKAGTKLSPVAQARAQKLISELVERKRHRTVAQRKIDTALLDQMTISRGQWLTKNIKTIATGVEVDRDGRVVVELAAKVTDSLLAALKERRSDLLSVVPRFSSILIKTPLQGLEQIAMLPGVQMVKRKPEMKTNTITSKGDKKHRADVARSTFGLSGHGITVGVISDSIDGLVDSVLAGELPDTSYLLGQEGVGTGEGTAMLEIVHDVAPNASLMFATGTVSEAQMAANILDLYIEGCQVFVDDVTYFAEPAFQDGPISRAINTVTAAGGLYFSSASNAGSLTASTSSVWEGDYNYSGTTDPGVGAYHTFGSSFANGILTPTNVASLQWSDPLGASSNDYDIYVVNPDGTLYANSTNVQSGTQDPLETCSAAAGTYIIVIKFSGDPRYLRVWATEGVLQVATAGQTFGHNAAKNAFSVAASDANVDYPTPFSALSPIEIFSADGPRRIFFNADGTAITPGNFLASGGMALQKPDITAADGVQTSLAGFSPFYGTSAAAPHAAAIAALMLEANPIQTVDSMRSLFQLHSWDTLGVGWDRDSGFGIIDAFKLTGASVLSTTQATRANATIASGQSNRITLTVSHAYTAPLTLFVSSNIPGTTMPSSVIIPANQTSVSFTVTPPANNTGSDRDVSITYSPDGNSSSAITFVETPSIHLSYISVDVTECKAGSQLTCTIGLTGAATSNQIFSMSTSDPYVFPCPATTNITAGNSSRTFKVTTKGVAVDKVISWGVSGGGWAASVDVTVRKGVLTSVSLNPAAVAGGSLSTGTAVIDGVAPPGGFVVTLAAADSAVVGVPASVTIPEGARSAPFPITTKPVAVNKSYGIFCRLNGVLVRPFLRVNAPKISSLNISPSSVTGGFVATGYIGITSPAPAGGFTITLASNKLQASVPPTVTIPAGEIQKAFFISTSPVTASVLATISASKTGSVTKSKGLRITP